MSRMTRWLVLVCGLLLMAAPVFAATQNAVVYGTVYDAAGNPMAGVSVVLENPALGFSRATTTGSDGSYNFAEVPPAEGYKLTAAKGDKKLDIRAGITVNVGDERVILPPLKEQAATTAAAPVVERKSEGQAVRNETVSTSISGVITSDQLHSLPLYNRNFLALGLLTPNTHDTSASSELRGASFSVAGNQPNNNDFLLDGADNVASGSNQSLPFQVNDSVQEFRLVSSTASAEYGRNAGGVVNVVTRRGGNAFHGSVFGYFGSDRFNADNPLSVYNGSTFDQAAAYAGDPTTTGFSGFNPLRYNDYVATAEFFGFCTNSQSAFTMVPGTVPCTAGGTGGTGENTRFDPTSVLAANNRFKPSFDSKQFGINAGGPLMKDKVFYFLSYEGTRINNPNPIFERVPTTFDKTYDPFGTGSFSFAPGNPFGQLDYELGACTSVTVACGTNRGILSLFPNSNVVGVPGVLEFFRGEAPNFTHVHNGLARLDIVKSVNDSFTVRYVAQGLQQLHDDTLPVQANYPGNGAERGALNQSINGTWSHTISPTLINELRFGFQRFHLDESAQDASFNANTLGDPGPNVYGTASNFPNRFLSTILLNGMDTQYSGAVPGTVGAYCSYQEYFAIGPCQAPTLDYLFPFARLGAPLNAPSAQRDDTWTIADSVSWTRGKHAIRFGAELRKLNNLSYDAAWSRGLVYSSDIGQFTSDSGGITCNQACPSGSQEAFTFPSFDFAQTQSAPYRVQLHSYAVAGFIQDTWRIHPRVTVNLGLRYEFFSVPAERNNLLWNFDPVANGLVQLNHRGVQDPYGFSCGGATPIYESIPAAQGPFPAGPWACNAAGNGDIGKSNRRNFSPRVGIAWDMFGNGKTVLRFGYGLFYDQLPINYYSHLMYNRPTGIANGNPNSTFGMVASLNVAGFCAGTGDTCGAGNSFLNPATAAFSNFPSFVQAAMPFGLSAIDVPHSDTPRVHQFNVTLQRQLNSHAALEAGYVGSIGQRLPAVNNSNFGEEWGGVTTLLQDNFSTSPIFTMANLAKSDYHSLMARVRLAGWHGLRVNSTYTWSKSTDNVAGTSFPLLPVSGPNLLLGYELYGTQNFTPDCIYINLFCGIAPNTFPNISFVPSAVTTTGAGAVLTSPYTIPQDPFNYLVNDHGRSDFDSKHRLVVDYTWEIPGDKSSALKGNWAVSGIFIAQSGQPFTIFSGNILGEITQRATATGPVAVSDNPASAISTANLVPASFGCPFFSFPFTPFQPTAGTACTGNTGRNAFTGPNYVNTDVAVQKGFRLFGEGRMLTLRAEIYNLLDRSNFYNPISTLTTDGSNLNPDFGKIKSAHSPRQIQFGVRYTW